MKSVCGRLTEKINLALNLLTVQIILKSLYIINSSSLLTKWLLCKEGTRVELWRDFEMRCNVGSLVDFFTNQPIVSSPALPVSIIRALRIIN
jgi:hypothetical protein